MLSFTIIQSYTVPFCATDSTLPTEISPNPSALPALSRKVASSDRSSPSAKEIFLLLTVLS